MSKIELGPGHGFNEPEYVEALSETLDFHRNRGSLNDYLERVEADQQQRMIVGWINSFTNLPETLDNSVGPKVTYLRTQQAYRQGFRLAIQGARMTSSEKVVQTMSSKRIGNCYPEFTQATKDARQQTQATPTIWSEPIRDLGASAYAGVSPAARVVVNNWADYLSQDSNQMEYFRMAFCVGMTATQKAVQYQVGQEFASFMRHAGMTETTLDQLPAETHEQPND